MNLKEIYQESYEKAKKEIKERKDDEAVRQVINKARLKAEQDSMSIGEKLKGFLDKLGNVQPLPSKPNKKQASNVNPMDHFNDVMNKMVYGGDSNGRE